MKLDIRIGNRTDAINLIDELVIIADRCTNACPVSEKEDLRKGLKALKDALEREVV